MVCWTSQVRGSHTLNCNRNKLQFKLYCCRIGKNENWHLNFAGAPNCNLNCAKRQIAIYCAVLVKEERSWVTLARLQNVTARRGDTFRPPRTHSVIIFLLLKCRTAPSEVLVYLERRLFHSRAIMKRIGGPKSAWSLADSVPSGRKMANRPRKPSPKDVVSMLITKKRV